MGYSKFKCHSDFLEKSLNRLVFSFHDPQLPFFKFFSCTLCSTSFLYYNFCHPHGHLHFCLTYVRTSRIFKFIFKTIFYLKHFRLGLVKVSIDSYTQMFYSRRSIARGFARTKTIRIRASGLVGDFKSVKIKVLRANKMHWGVKRTNKINNINNFVSRFRLS